MGWNRLKKWELKLQFYINYCKMFGLFSLENIYLSLDLAKYLIVLS